MFSYERENGNDVGQNRLGRHFRRNVDDAQRVAIALPRGVGRPDALDDELHVDFGWNQTLEGGSVFGAQFDEDGTDGGEAQVPSECRPAGKVGN